MLKMPEFRDDAGEAYASSPLERKQRELNKMVKALKNL